MLNSSYILLMILQGKKHTSFFNVKQKSKICAAQSEGFCNLLYYTYHTLYCTRYLKISNICSGIKSIIQLQIMMAILYLTLLIHYEKK